MIAILCAGQGDQHRGMFDLIATEERADPVFVAAARHLGGRDPRSLVRDEAVDIYANRTAQLLCTVRTLGMWAVLSPDIGHSVRIVAGYSVGEVAAWHVAGAIDVATTLSLVARRAALMDAASDGTGAMVAVSGLQARAIDRLTAEAKVHEAIRNADDRVILGGDANGIDRAAVLAADAGAAQVTRLPVTVASHTPLMAKAASAFERVLTAERSHVSAPSVRLLSGIDGKPVFDVGSGLAKLARQIAEPVDWRACLAACAASGIERALDLGAGSALARMMVARLGQRYSRGVDEFRSTVAVLEWAGGSPSAKQ